MSILKRKSAGRAVPVSERIFRALLLAYPASFRADFGQQMAQTFRDQLRATRSGGASRVVWLWARTLSDIASTAIQERSEEMQGRGSLMLCAAAIGMAIAWVDSRPSWDDTGITAGTIFIACALFGAISPKQAWQWALAVGIWIPLYGILHSNYGAIIALIPAFLGAYLGAGLRSMAFPPPDRA